MYQCATCSEDFSSLKNFDRHRVGKHAVGKRCLNVSEIEGIGLARNARGRWCNPAASKRMRDWFSDE
jgi:hypothetical protein